MKILNIKLIAALALPFLCVAASVPEHIQCEILKGCDEMSGNGTADMMRTFRVEASINALTNIEQRIACVAFWMDSIEGVDIEALGYRKQERAVILFSDAAITSIYNILDRCNAPLKCKYNFLLRGFSRLRKVHTALYALDRSKLKDMTKEEKQEWSHCYSFVAACYEARLIRMEKRYFCRDKEKANKEEISQVREIVESYLGRPIRTPAQASEDWRSQQYVECSQERLWNFHD